MNGEIVKIFEPLFPLGWGLFAGVLSSIATFTLAVVAFIQIRKDRAKIKTTFKIIWEDVIEDNRTSVVKPYHIEIYINNIGRRPITITGWYASSIVRKKFFRRIKDIETWHHFVSVQ